MSQDNEPPFADQEERAAEILTPSVAMVQQQVEIDVAIATAHRFPRSPTQFINRAISLATISPEIAASCEYAKPVGGEKVKGPSARLAEIVAATYGNIRVQARVISESATQVTAQGVAHDLETNTAQSTEVTVSLLKRDGRRVGPEQVATARASACAKARRNATFLVVPLAIVQPIIARARQVAAGKAETLPERREALLVWFESKGMKRSKILEWLEVKAVTDIDLDQMADLIAAQNTAKEEGVDLAEIFGRKAESSRFSDDAPPASAGKAALDKATAEAAKREPEKKAPTRAACVALSKRLDDNAYATILEGFGTNAAKDVPEERLAEFHAALTKALPTEGAQP